jgi:T4 RnlA family RNA ligase
MKYILKYNDAQEICKKYNNNNFWEFTFMKDEYKLAAFNYFICGWNDFANPLPNKPEVNAFDMRGVTFVFNKDGSLWKSFLMLPKFYNLNQVESTQYGVVKDKKILNITSKEDGSLVAFMMLPNGKLFSKTIGSFTSEQAENAYKLLYEDEERVNWVKGLLKDGYTPLFEYVSWDNRVVLKYSQPQLRFIGIRDNISGEYFTASEMVRFNIPLGVQQIESYAGDLDFYIEEAKTREGKEGWVVKFIDGQLIKIKTAWYFKLHGLRTQDINREDYVIKNYLEETLDDIMTQLDPEEDADAYSFVSKVTKAIDNYVIHIDKTVQELVDEYNSSLYFGHWAKFATDKHKAAFFGLARTKIETPENYQKKKKEIILALTFHLKQAKQIVERWKESK